MAYTQEQKIKLLTKNKIFTIHKDFIHLFPKCYHKENGCVQIMVEKVIKQPKRNKYQMIGRRFNSPEFTTLDELIQIIDWADYQERTDFCDLQ